MSFQDQSRPRLPALAPPDVRYASISDQSFAAPRLVATGQKATLSWLTRGRRGRSRGSRDITAHFRLWCVTREDEVSCFHLLVASEAGLHHRLVGRRFAILEVTKPPPAGRGVLL